MGLFSDRLVEDMQRLPGAPHSFLQQVCAAQGGRQRSALDSLLEAAGPALAERAHERLTSLDNRRFFQGYAELAVASFLARGRLRVQEVVQPGAYLRASTLSGQQLNLAVMSFIHKGRLVPDRATVDRLLAALNRVGSKQRMVVVVHGRLPSDFDSEEVRRAVDSWLSEVERGTWEGRYATFIDEAAGIHLEFGLTGRTTRRGSRVCLKLGPFTGPASLAAVEPRVLAELDRYRLGAHSGEPLMLVCAADQPWLISRGYMRDFLYGLPRSIEGYRDRDSHDVELLYSGERSSTLFRDPLFADLCGILWMGRDGQDPTRAHARFYLNPWAREPIDPELLPACATLALSRWRDDSAVLRWRSAGETRVSLL